MRHIVIASICVVVAFYTSRAFAEALAQPGHAHENIPNAVTWVSPTHTNGDAHPSSIHQHQHRTNHDPAAGVFVEGGNGGVPGNGYAAYNASPEWVWVGRELVSSGNITPGVPPLPAGYSPHAQLPDEWAHGNQSSSFPFAARYAILPAVATVSDCAADGICAAEANAWNVNAATLAFNAFNGIGAGGLGWIDVTRAGGLNWPTSDNTQVAGTGARWVSDINWALVTPSTAHELNIAYGEAGAGNKAITKATNPNYDLSGHYSSGAAAMTITIDDDIDWFFGYDPNPANFPLLHDMQTTMLHEVGHALGLGHFGTYDRGYIMADQNIAGTTGRPNRGGLGGINHTIDPDAIHGMRDLYALAAPEPTGAALVLTSLVACAGFRKRR